jgi:hypothetical protein
MTRTLEELREYLVGEWKFDNNFLDTSGNGNHGVPTDIEWKPTSRGLKPTVSGDGEININVSNDNLHLANSSFSISIWAKANTTGDRRILFGQGSNPAESEALHIFYSQFDRLNMDFYGGYALTGTIDTLKWNHIVCQYNHSTQTQEIYVNGVIEQTKTNISPFIGNNVTTIFGWSINNTDGFDGSNSEVSVYKNTTLTDDEVLALYNSTKNAYGVRPAERSFTHRLQPEVDANTVAAFDMSTKNADGTLMDLSGNSNHGDIRGAVRAGGYFTDGMRFDGVDNKIEFTCDYSELDVLHISMLIFVPDDGKDSTLLSNAIANTGNGFHIRKYTNGYIYTYHGGGMSYVTNVPFKKYLLYETIIKTGEYIKSYINGNLLKNVSLSESYSLQKDTITRMGGMFNSIVKFVNISQSELSESQIKSRFNSLATLPLYTFDASKYPTSDGWTTNVPYSSMSISSGEFSFTDDGQLQCDSAGSFTLRNAHEFDGDEYIKIIIDGVEYTGTGSVSQGNVTVAITQSSTKIDVDMGTSDLIDGIDIQFREPVE